MQYLTVQETKAGLSCTGKDKDKPDLTISNFLLIMLSDAKYAGVKFNELRGVAEIHGKDKSGNLTIATWSDAHEAESMSYIEDKYGLYSKERHTAALRMLFAERTYNPLIDIIESVKWDGKERCRNYLTKWGKCADTPYVHEVSRLIFAGGIHRLYEPGRKFEDVPILMGDQGGGKSTLIRFLAINDDYHGEVKQMDGQQAIEDLSGHWILEIPEMSAFTKAKDQEAIKAFVSRQRDQYRKPYDRNPVELPRRCIFIATSNDRNPLVDKTGNRRWYPVECTGDRAYGYELYRREDEVREYVLQCWAEAKAKMHTDEMKPFAKAELLEEYTKAQEEAMQDDWRVGAIKLFLEQKNPGELTCVRELFHRALSPNPDFVKEPTFSESKDIAKIMDSNKDWERVGNKRIGTYGVQKCWKKRGEKPTEDDDDFPFM